MQIVEVRTNSGGVKVQGTNYYRLSSHCKLLKTQTCLRDKIRFDYSPSPVLSAGYSLTG